MVAVGVQATIERPPLFNGTPSAEPSFAYTDLRGIGKVDIDDLLEQDPGLVHDLHETMRTLLMSSNTGSMCVTYEVFGWSAAREKALRGRQLRKKLNLIGVTLPADVEEMIDEMDPVMAGG